MCWIRWLWSFHCPALQACHCLGRTIFMQDSPSPVAFKMYSLQIYHKTENIKSDSNNTVTRMAFCNKHACCCCCFSWNSFFFFFFTILHWRRNYFMKISNRFMLILFWLFVWFFFHLYTLIFTQQVEKLARFCNEYLQCLVDYLF